MSTFKKENINFYFDNYNFIYRKRKWRVSHNTKYKLIISWEIGKIYREFFLSDNFFVNNFFKILLSINYNIIIKKKDMLENN